MPGLMRSRHLLKPPVGTKIYIPVGDYIVMIVAGPTLVKTIITTKRRIILPTEGSIKVIIQEDVKRWNAPHAICILIQPKRLISCAFRGFYWACHRKEPDKVLQTARFGFATFATTNYMKSILNSNIEKIFCRILNISNQFT
jgi:hypothetical protein